MSNEFPPNILAPVPDTQVKEQASEFHPDNIDTDKWYSAKLTKWKAGNPFGFMALSTPFQEPTRVYFNRQAKTNIKEGLDSLVVGADLEIQVRVGNKGLWAHRIRLPLSKSEPQAAPESAQAKAESIQNDFSSKVFCPLAPLPVNKDIDLGWFVVVACDISHSNKVYRLVGSA